MESNALISLFEAFKKERDAAKEDGLLSIDSLTQQFGIIAQHLIYCGHFEVRSNGKLIRCIQLDTVEFYYHEEGDGKIKDYIVYHRNKDKTPDVYLKAFPLGSLNTHVSGVDITFEDQSDKPEYRASVLIRAFHVKEKEHTKELPHCPEEVEKRSTYLYEYLFMGIPITDGVQIQWVVDSEHTDSIPNRGYRVNVHKYVSGENGLPKKRKKEKTVRRKQDNKRKRLFYVATALSAFIMIAVITALFVWMFNIKNVNINDSAVVVQTNEAETTDPKLSVYTSAFIDNKVNSYTLQAEKRRKSQNYNRLSYSDLPGGSYNEGHVFDDKSLYIKECNDAQPWGYFTHFTEYCYDSDGKLFYIYWVKTDDSIQLFIHDDDIICMKAKGDSNRHTYGDPDITNEMKAKVTEGYDLYAQYQNR